MARHPFCVPVLLALLMVGPVASAQRLTDFCRAALAGSPYLKLRELELDRARAEQDIAGSRLLPQLAAQGSWSHNDYRESLLDERRYEGQRAGLSARLALVDMPSRHRRDASRDATQQRVSEVAQTRMALLVEVIDVYLKSLQTEDEIAALEAEREAVRRQVERLRAMRERQMAKVTDLAETEAYLQTLVTRGIDTRNQREQSWARLSELTGMSVTTLAPLAQRLFDLASGPADEAVAVALRDHPRLAALGHAIEAARKTVAAVRSEHLPQLALVGSHNYADVGFDNRRQPPYHATSLGLELRIPLYEGGRVDAATREAQARVSIAQQQYEAARREIERETRAAWGSARANHARIDSTQQEVTALEQTVRAQERGVELGVSNVINLLDARRRLIRARVDADRARYDYMRDLANLQVARGALTDADIVAWDRWFAPNLPAGAAPAEPSR